MRWHKHSLLLPIIICVYLETWLFPCVKVVIYIYVYEVLIASLGLMGCFASLKIDTLRKNYSLLWWRRLDLRLLNRIGILIFIISLALTCLNIVDMSNSTFGCFPHLIHLFESKLVDFRLLWWIYVWIIVMSLYYWSHSKDYHMRKIT